jgi:imidazolonepropionase-like amidohydrolase
MGASHGISFAFRKFIEEGLIPGPRVVACGMPICVTGGHANGICIQADGPYEVRRAARSQLAAGADFIKVMASHDPIEIDGPEKTRPEMEPDEIRAAYDEARAHGKRTACHVMGTIAIGRVLDAGVNVISHGFYLNDELACRMAEQGVFLDPTLSSYGRQTINPRLKRGEKWSSDHMPLIPAMESAFRAAVKAKVKIVTGTDSAGRYAEDVAMMREFGLDPMESLLACTRNAADALGLGHEIGTLEAGKVADIIVLRGDPLADAYNLEKVSHVVKDGKLLTPSEISIGEIVGPDIW